MPRGKVVLDRNNFTAGLITENNPLNPVENSMQEVTNFVLERTGDIRRRLGIRAETDYAEIDIPSSLITSPSTMAYKEFTWDNPGGDLSKEFLVQQRGTHLHFLNMSTDNPSANLANLGQPFTLAPLQGPFPPGDPLEGNITDTFTGQTQLSFATVSGYLVFTCKEFSKPYYLYYDKDEDSFHLGVVTLKVRDLWGVYDHTAVSERPTVLTSAHAYNLLNQGWGEVDIKNNDIINADGTIIAVESETGTLTSVVDIFNVYNSEGGYPSNADIATLYSSNDDENVRTNNSTAPKGRFVVPAFDRGVARAQLTTGWIRITTLPTDSDDAGVSHVSGFGDRLFYSGSNAVTTDGDVLSPNFSSTIFFSRLIKSPIDFGRCFQEADPTSEHFSETVASDGGFVTITEANNIIALRTLGASLLVFADNGVWSISGPEGVFKANDYAVTKLSSVGAVNSDSIVIARNGALFWSQEGIFSVSPTEITGVLQVSPFIETTIQTFYNEIPTVAKLYAKATYDRVEQRVRWLYNDLDAYDGVLDRYVYNKELVFDGVLQAWYPNDFGAARIHGYAPTSPYNSALNVQDVTYNGDLVEHLGEQVTYTISERTSSLSKTKYVITAYGTGFVSAITLGELADVDFLDWAGTADEADTAARFLGHWESGGDASRRKDVEYLHMYFKRTEIGIDIDGNPINPSSCLVRTRWDFSDSASSNKWSRQREMYRYKRLWLNPNDGTIDYGQGVLTTKDKIRGSGKSLALEIESVPGKDCHIHGWTLSLLGNQST